MILILYTSLLKASKTGNAETPPFTQYTHLYSTYPQTLICPCSKISINYGRFTRINYTLHQICDSIFVNQSWISCLYNQTEKQVVSNSDVPAGSLAFQALRSFCNLSDQRINYSLARFYSDQYISASIIPQKSFEAEINSLINRLQSTLKSTFSLSLAIIRNTTQANALFSAIQTNCKLSVSNHRFINIIERQYSNCSCAFSPTCIKDFSISNCYGSEFIVPGFYTGCFVVESLFQSNFECFYDQECVDKFKSCFPSLSSMNVTALDASLTSYPKNSTIKYLIDNLMIEQWNNVTVFEDYYNECQPMQCTYTFETHHDIVYIFTTLFGIVGGLATILELVVPRSLKIIAYCIRKRRTRIVPEMSAVRM